MARKVGKKLEEARKTALAETGRKLATQRVEGPMIGVSSEGEVLSGAGVSDSIQTHCEGVDEHPEGERLRICQLILRAAPIFLMFASRDDRETPRKN